jgi:hypothetical protein
MSDELYQVYHINDTVTPDEYREALVRATSPEDAVQQFGAIYPEVPEGDFVEVNLAYLCNECGWPSIKQSNVRDISGADAYTCHVCENCGHHFGGDLDHA